MTPISSSRTVTLFNDDWQFQLNDQRPKSDSWQTISLPHDWSILQPFSNQWDGATGYLPGGMGWYRKQFSNPLPEGSNRKAFLLFDGIYNNATILLNNREIHFQANGYAPFYLEITPFLDAENILQIQVDRRRYVDSRWYTGSGIYRDVHLITTNQTHVPIWENVVRTRLEQQQATVSLELTLVGIESNESDIATIETTLVDQSSGNAVTMATHTLPLTSTRLNTSVELTFAHPKLWHPDSPYLYQLQTNILINGTVIDSLDNTLGIRSFDFCKKKGFSINGKETPIQGVCLHHDGGLVGAAVPDEIWRRRLIKLKACGVNAIRIAHNPASDRLLNLCDEIGLLVQDEFFDEWDYPKDKRLNMGEQYTDFVSRGYSEHFQTCAETDLKNTLRCHINHPCIFMWSIGNEIEWTYPRNVEATGFFDAKWDGNYFWNQPPHSPKQIKQLLSSLPEHDYNIGQTAQKLSRWVKTLDTSRPITANCILPSASYLSGYADALDVIGFSYRRVIYDYGHQYYPQLPIIGNENLTQWHEWQAVAERPFVSGLFLWTGVNYMGESHGQWPVRTTNSGLLDAAGFEKPSAYLFQSLWTKQPMVKMTTVLSTKRDVTCNLDSYEAVESDPEAWKTKLWTWPDCNEHWNYQLGETILIEAFSNCQSTELFINNVSYGKRLLADQVDRTFRWAIPYIPGALKLVGYNQGLVACEQLIHSAEQVDSISVQPESLADEAYQQLIIQLIDAQGRPVRHQEQTLSFKVEGAEWIGADNGSIRSLESHKNLWISTRQGRALAVVRLSPEGRGAVEVSVKNKASVRIDLARHTR